MAHRISIKPSDIESLTALTEAVNGDALKHTFTAEEVVSFIPEIEELRIDTRLPKGLSIGMEATVVSAGPSANAYRSAWIGSQARYRYCADGWRVVGFERLGRWPKSPQKVTLIASEEQIAEIKNRSVAGIFVRKAA